MKNKGFIATSLIYSFFLVFLALLAVILSSHVFNNRLMNEFNKAILNRINRKIDGTSDVPSYIEEDLEKLGIIPNLGQPDFNYPAISDEGVYSTNDNDGRSYYYRGDVDNNYIIFGNWNEGNLKSAPIYWRIIRINGDGSLRLMFDGYKLGQTYINDPYATVQWGNAISSDDYDSAFENKLNEFYIKNIKDTKYEDVISDVGFCSTKTSYVLNAGACEKSEDKILCGGIEKDLRDFSDYDKIVELKNTTIGTSPSLNCKKENLYTVSSAKGNGKLTYPIGVITSNEIIMAGGQNTDPNATNPEELSNIHFYLYKNIDYWTMSLFSRTMNTNVPTSTMSIKLLNSINNQSVSEDFLFYFSKNGYLSYTQLNSMTIGVYPVINIKEEYITTLEGDGTISNPYVGELNRG